MKNKLFTKLVLTYFTLIFCTVFLTGFLMSVLFENFYFKFRSREMLMEASSIAKEVSSFMDTNFDDEELLEIVTTEFGSSSYQDQEDLVLSKISPLLAVRVSKIEIVDRAGRIIAQSNPYNSSSVPKEFLFERKSVSNDEKISFLKGEKSVAQRYFNDRRKQFLSVTVPVFDSNKVVSGAVIMHAPIIGLKRIIGEVRLLLFVSGSIVMLFGFFFVYYLSKRITTPITQMEEVALAMSQGDFRSRVQVASSDEIGQLGKTINHLASEVRQRTHALDQEKSKIESMLKSIAEGVIAIDVQGKIILVNKRLEDICMVSEDDLSGKFLKETKLNSFFGKELLEVINDKRPVSKEIKLDGLKKIIIIHASPVLDIDGILDGVVGIVQDISERWLVERMQKNFLGNVSHELRTPLSMIQGYTEAIIDGLVKDSETRDKYTRVIYGESLRLKRMVENFLTLSKLEEGIASKEELVINEVVYEALAKMKPKLEAKGIDIELEFLDKEFAIVGNRDMLVQVIFNLLENAVRYSPEKSKICLGINEGDDNIQLSISDNGIGIPEQDLPRIWERFYQVDKARDRSQGGVGLGLSIVKQIIEMHGGDVSVKSRFGEGTTFTFTLPKVS